MTTTVSTGTGPVVSRRLPGGFVPDEDQGYYIAAVFLPVAFMEGRVGRFFHSFGLTVGTLLALGRREAVIIGRRVAPVDRIAVRQSAASVGQA